MLFAPSGSRAPGSGKQGSELLASIQHEVASWQYAPRMPRWLKRILSKPIHAILIALIIPAILAGLIIGGVITPVHPAKGHVAPKHAALLFDYSSLSAAISSHEVKTATIFTDGSVISLVLKDGETHALPFVPSTAGQLASGLVASGAHVSVSNGLAPVLASLRANDKTNVPLIVGVVLFILLACGLAIFFGERNKKGGGLGASGGFGGKIGQYRQHVRARGSRVKPGEVAVRFTDIAGCEEAIEEVKELVDWLRHPERYERVGAKMPTGVILHGPAGNGKTLLAKAIAGEADVPFFPTSGSDFVEMFVGVGSARVRDVFRKARAEEGGAVIFIDEIDAVGKTRTSGPMSNDERNSTLNQLLVEIDGFHGSQVIVIAATNLLESLDPALLRSGRLERSIHIGPPSEAGRLQILGIHSRGKPLDASVDLAHLATTTAGSSGANLAQMINEAAIMAAREDSGTISKDHLKEGFLRTVAGPRKLSAAMAEGELELFAVHEAGHAAVAEFCATQQGAPHVTINPRGRAGGFTVMSNEDRATHNEQFVHERLMCIMGGRAAEFVAYGTVSSGAAGDLVQANAIAREAIESFGFSSKVGQVIPGQRGFSEQTRGHSDSEVRRMVDNAYCDAVSLIEEHRAQLDRLVAVLLKSGDVDRPEIAAALHGGEMKPYQPHDSAFMPGARPITEQEPLPTLPQGDPSPHMIPEYGRFQQRSPLGSLVSSILSLRRRRRASL